VPTLTAVVPATDAPPSLDRCRVAIEGAAEPPDEVVVVEDGGLTATQARNAGVARATGEVVVFVDADVEVHADAFRRIRAAFTGDPALDALFGSYDDAPGDPGVVSTFRNLLHHHVHQRSAGPAETFWTGLGAVRRSAFLAAGGFDEETYRHPSIEDIELGTRLRSRGATIRLDPSVQGTHLKTWTLRSMVWTDLVRRGVPWICLQVRTRRAATTLNCGWRHRISAAAVVLLLVAALMRAPLFAAATASAVVLLNHGFYRVLLSRLGPLGAVAGVGLHAIHHLVAVASVPVGIAAAVHAGRRDPRRRVGPWVEPAALDELVAE
jgi:hypothetical protein